MSQEIHWQQRYEIFTQALSRLNEALQANASEPHNHLYQIALIGAFQFTFELAWKTLKDYLAYGGIDASLPRDVIRQACHHQLIEEGQLWIDMLEARNLLAHAYQEEKALEATQHIRTQYVQAIVQVHTFLQSKLKSS